MKNYLFGEDPYDFKYLVIPRTVHCTNISWLTMFWNTGNTTIWEKSKAEIKQYLIIQGMVDGSASKPPLRQDTGYMLEKTYLDIAPYLGAFGAYLMPQ